MFRLLACDECRTEVDLWDAPIHPTWVCAMKNLDAVSRRKALQMLAGSLAAGAAFPRCAYPVASSASEEALQSPGRIKPIFKPTRIGNRGKPTPYCIDVHAHIFNSSDIDAMGFMKKDVAHSIDNVLLRELVVGLAEVVGALALIAPAVEAELGKLKAFLAKLVGVEKDEAVKAFLQSEARAHRDIVSKNVAYEMKKRKLDQTYTALQQAHAQEMRRTFGDLKPSTEGPTAFEESIAIAIDPVRRLKDYQARYGGRGAPEKSLDPGGYVEFVGHMLAYRWMNLQDYTYAYTEANDAFGVDAMFASFVNFDYWLAPAKRSPQVEQMKLHSLLSIMSGGYMLPIVAYNPWTDIEEQDASFELVKKAIGQYGFVGVKIYPPMGFMPYGNSEPYPGKQAHPDVKKLNAVMLRLATWCAQNNVPIMAHSGESNGRDQGEDEFGGPNGWKALLQKLEITSPSVSLVGNLGHFGGGSDEPRHPKNDWPSEFAKLMRDPPENRLYGDLAYWEQLRWCDAKHPKCTVAKSRLKAAIRANPAVTGRIMFGTDWDMLSQEPDWGSYPSQVIGNLGGLLPSMEKFLYLNALACFGLAPGGAQRNRVIARLSAAVGDIPPWLKNAPAVTQGQD